MAAKWLLLIFLLCEAVALVLSLLLRFVLDPPNPATAYNNFDEVRTVSNASQQWHGAVRTANGQQCMQLLLRSQAPWSNVHMHYSMRHMLASCKC